MYFEAFSRNVNEVIDLATALAKRYGCRYIGSEHILFGLINVSDGRAAAILSEAGVDNERFLAYFQRTVDKTAVISGNMFTPRTKRLFETAVDISLKSHSGFVGTEHLLLALLLDGESLAVAILKHLKVNVQKMAEEISQLLFGNAEPEVDEIEEEQPSFGAAFVNAGANARREKYGADKLIADQNMG